MIVGKGIGTNLCAPIHGSGDDCSRVTNIGNEDLLSIGKDADTGRAAEPHIREGSYHLLVCHCERFSDTRVDDLLVRICSREVMIFQVDLKLVLQDKG